MEDPNPTAARPTKKARQAKQGTKSSSLGGSRAPERRGTIAPVVPVTPPTPRLQLLQQEQDQAGTGADGAATATATADGGGDGAVVLQPRKEFMSFLLKEQLRQHVASLQDRNDFASHLSGLALQDLQVFLLAMAQSARRQQSQSTAAEAVATPAAVPLPLLVQQPQPTGGGGGAGGGAPSLSLVVKQQHAYIEALTKQLKQAENELAMTLHRQGELHGLASAYVLQKPIVLGDTSVDLSSIRPPPPPFAATAAAPPQPPLFSPLAAPTTMTTTTTTAAATSIIGSANLFQYLSEDIHAHILSYLMAVRQGLASPPHSAWQLYHDENLDNYVMHNPYQGYWEVKQALEGQFEGLSDRQRAIWIERAQEDQSRYNKQLAAITTGRQLGQICQNLSVVSKQWYGVVGVVMNAKAAPVDVLTPTELFAIKCRAKRLALTATPPLTSSSIGTDFIKFIRERWDKRTPIDDYDEGRIRPLDLIIEQFGEGSDAKFAELVAAEYTKFLVVKSVETIAAAKSKHTSVEQDEEEANSLTLDVWNETCHPSLLVDLFWHAHMLSPVKYARDCQSLLGDIVGTTMAPANVTGPSGTGGVSSSSSIIGAECIIDHTHGEASGYASKRDALFEFEAQLAEPKDYFGGRRDDRGSAEHILFSEQFNLRRVAAEIWQDKGLHV